MDENTLKSHIDQLIAAGATDQEIMDYVNSVQNNQPEQNNNAVDAQAVQDKVNQMIRDQRPAREVRDYLASTNNPGSPQLEDALNQYEYGQQTGQPVVFNVDMTSPEARALSKPVGTESSTGGAFIRGAGQGLTFNFGDELAAAAQAAGQTLGDYLTNQNQDQSFGNRYDQNVEANRAQLRADEQQHPYATAAGNVAGALVLPGAGVAAGVRGGLAARAALEAATGRGALYNAGRAALEGGLAGAGNAEGGIADRATGAAIGAGTGIAIDRFGRAIGGAISPRIAPGTQVLNEAGVNLTPAMRVDTPGVGRVARMIENVAAYAPIVGPGVRAAQKDAATSIERGAYNNAMRNASGDIVPTATRTEHAADYALGAGSTNLTPQAANQLTQDVATIQAAKEIATREGSDVVAPIHLEVASRGVEATRQLGGDATNTAQVLQAIDDFSRSGTELPLPASMNEYISSLKNKFPDNAYSTGNSPAVSVGDALTAGGLYLVGGAAGVSPLGAARAVYSPLGRKAVDMATTGRQGPVARTGRTVSDMIVSALPNASAPGASDQYDYSLNPQVDEFNNPANKQKF